MYNRLILAILKKKKKKKKKDEFMIKIKVFFGSGYSIMAIIIENGLSYQNPNPKWGCFI